MAESYRGNDRDDPQRHRPLPRQWNGEGLYWDGPNTKAPDYFTAIVIGEPGLLFQTAHDLREMLDLDYLPEVIEMVDVPMPQYGDTREHGDPIKFCRVSNATFVPFYDVAEFDEERFVDFGDGQALVVHSPLRMVKPLPTLNMNGEPRGRGQSPVWMPHLGRLYAKLKEEEKQKEKQQETDKDNDKDKENDKETDMQEQGDKAAAQTSQTSQADSSQTVLSATSQN